MLILRVHRVKRRRISESVYPKRNILFLSDVYAEGNIPYI